MPTFVSPDGNFEAWETQPIGYFDVEEWERDHPQPEPPTPTYDQLRQTAILKKWPMSAQLEALTEAAEDPPRPEKMNQLLTDIQEVKEQYPKTDVQ